MTEVTVYTDGACDRAGNGGWAWIAVRDGRVLTDGSGGERETTNNQMELRAVIEALKSGSGLADALIVTDSAYVSNCFLERWYDGWRANGWINSKKKPVENRELWEELLAHAEAWRGELNWLHVRGHGKRATDDPEHVRWNAEVDRIAVQERAALTLEPDNAEYRMTSSERSTYQALRARGVVHAEALDDALDGVSVESVREELGPVWNPPTRQRVSPPSADAAEFFVRGDKVGLHCLICGEDIGEDVSYLNEALVVWERHRETERVKRVNRE